MGNLEDKLREIILMPYRYPKGDGATMFDDKGDIPILDTQIAQIKQAFVDEGYGTIKELAELIIKQPVLTGPEWFDKFRYELGLSAGTKSEVVIKAARRASGIDT